MDFSYTPAQEKFREAFRHWLAIHLQRPWREEMTFASEGERLTFLKTWQGRLREAGWLAPHWPSRYGGRDTSIMEHIIVMEELLGADAPPLINGPSLSIFGPTLLAFGTEEQKRRYLPKLLSAEEIWCLGFSEPDAGSDLASLKTRAMLDGDDWIVTGQKVWTSYAQYADWGLFLVRTDPVAPQHRGISCLIIPMKSPGITVRPLRQITGDVDFNEVFLDHVRVPRESLVGEVNQGWSVILTALGHERGTLLVVDRIRLKKALEKLLLLSRRLMIGGIPAGKDPLCRQKIAQNFIEVEIMKLLTLHMQTRLQQGKPPEEVSVLKLFGSELAQRLYNLALEMEGPHAQLVEGSAQAMDSGEWQHEFLLARAFTIASGTSEIQRNIIAQRILKLPRA